jgi:serine/threonine protein phosphatase PrpC
MPKRLTTDNTVPKSVNEPAFFDDTIQSLLRLTSTERLIGATAFQEGNLKLICGGTINLLSIAGPEGSDKSDLNQDAALAWRADGPHTRAPDWIVAVADGVTSSRSSELGSDFAVHQAIIQLLKAYDDNIRAEQLGGFVFNEIQKLFLQIGDKLKKHPLKYIPPNEYATTWKRNVKKGRLLQTTLALAWAKGNQFHYASLGDSGLELYSNNNLRFKMKECDLDTNKVEAFGPNGGYHKSLLQTNTIKLNDPCVLILCTDGILRGYKNDLSSLQNCDLHQQLLSLCDDNTRRKDFDDNLTVVKVAFTPIS